MAPKTIAIMPIDNSPKTPAPFVLGTLVALVEAALVVVEAAEVVVEAAAEEEEVLDTALEEETAEELVTLLLPVLVLALVVKVLEDTGEVTVRVEEEV